MIYWNENCDRAVKVREKAKRVVMKSRNPADHMEFKRTKVVAKKVIKEAWRKRWRAFCTSLSHRPNVGTVRKVNRGINVKMSESIPALKKGEDFVNSNVEKANIMAEHFAKVTSISLYG